jgi:hypothetical protein
MMETLLLNRSRQNAHISCFIYVVYDKDFGVGIG